MIPKKISGGTSGQILAKKTDADNDTEWKDLSELEDIKNLANKYKGITKETTVVNSYVKLFSVKMVRQHKTNTTFFKLDDTQNGGFSVLGDLKVVKATNTEGISLVQFKNIILSEKSFSRKLFDLVAVVIDTNTVEVYCKMGTSQSPTLNIITNSQFTKDNSYSYIIEDCNTVVSELPAGTQYKAQSNINEYILYNNASGTSDNIPLSDNYNNYRKLKVYYGRSTYIGMYSYAEIDLEGGIKTMCLNCSYPSPDGLLIITANAVINLSGTNLTFTRNVAGNIGANGFTKDTNKLIIYKVVGIK